MTTNQTIDGVPRTALVSAMTAARLAGCWKVADELRALLDAPAIQHREVDGEHCPNPECCAWIAPNSECNQCKPAAQPQGEPVAWMDPRSPEMHATISNEVKQHNLKFGGAPSAAVNGYSIPLYAEQPAPVAVVLPERREPTQDNPYLSDADHEWNAFRDELKRLNPSL